MSHDTTATDAITLAAILSSSTVTNTDWAEVAKKSGRYSSVASARVNGNKLRAKYASLAADGDKIDSSSMKGSNSPKKASTVTKPSSKKRKIKEEDQALMDAEEFQVDGYDNDRDLGLDGKPLSDDA